MTRTAGVDARCKQPARCLHHAQATAYKLLPANSTTEQLRQQG